MVVLEKIDFKNFPTEKFKSVKCLCELCDDGCFERSKQQHHPECRQAINNQLSVKNSIANGTSADPKKCMLSHYRDTFIVNAKARPATTYRPPTNLFEYVPRGEIDFNTIQKTEYKPYEITEKTKLFKSIDKHERSIEPMSGVTWYNSEYINRDSGNFAHVVRRNPNEETIKKPNASISSKTTNKDHFQDWDSQSMTRGFSEHPSLAGSHLFPTGERNFDTSTGTFHEAKQLPKKSYLGKMEMKGSLRYEGDMDLATNYRDTFVKHKNPERGQKIVPRNDIVLNPNKNNSPSITQTKNDFVFYANHNPPKPADCNPFISNLNKDIYPGDNFDHTTNYSVDYNAYEIKDTVKTKSFKPENRSFDRPIEKLDGLSVTMRDFKPIDVNLVPALKAVKIDNKIKIPQGPMETQTMNKIHFPAYETKPVVFAKDQHPDYYVPPRDKFIGETTTGETFQGKQGFRSKLRKPDTINIELKGAIDLNTNYRNEFVNHGVSMCAAKAYLISQGIREKSALQENETSSQKSLINSISS